MQQTRELVPDRLFAHVCHCLSPATDGGYGDSATGAFDDDHRVLRDVLYGVISASVIHIGALLVSVPRPARLLLYLDLSA